MAKTNRPSNVINPACCINQTVKNFLLNPGGDPAPPVENNLLMEDGSDLLLEDGTNILLE